MLNEVYKCDGQGGPQPPPGWKEGDKPYDPKPDEPKHDDEQEEKPASA